MSYCFVVGHGLRSFTDPPAKPGAEGRGVPLDVLVYPTDRAAYGRLCRLLTLGKRRAEKGGCELELGDLLALAPGLVLVALVVLIITG